MTSLSKVRRTQEERTARTRLALVEGAISAIYKHGYAAASTVLIAEEAQTSRGAMVHHFSTRAALMAEVVRYVFEREMMEYEEIRSRTGEGDYLHHWPRILWRVLSKPSGLAVLEILQATKSDTELGEYVIPMQEGVERAALAAIRDAFGGDDQEALSVMRLMVWSIRGLSIAERYLPHRPETHHAVELLSHLLYVVALSGKIEDIGPWC